MTATPPPAPGQHHGKPISRRARDWLIALLVRAGLVEYATPNPTPPSRAAKAARIIGLILTTALLLALGFAIAIATNWADRPRPAQQPTNTINALPASPGPAPA